MLNTPVIVSSTTATTLTLGNNVRVPFIATATYDINSVTTDIIVTDFVTWSYGQADSTISNVANLRGELTTTAMATGGQITATLPAITATGNTLNISRDDDDATGLAIPMTASSTIAIDGTEQF